LRLVIRGCAAFSIKQIYVRNAEKIFAPEAFSPNNDGINDVFILKGYGIKNSHMTIYNRWGEVIFESNDFNIGWDGKVDGEYVLDNVYLYDISATGLSRQYFSLFWNHCHCKIIKCICRN
jgi:gliding motility-associated-like protein